MPLIVAGLVVIVSATVTVIYFAPSLSQEPPPPPVNTASEVKFWQQQLKETYGFNLDFGPGDDVFPPALYFIENKREILCRKNPTICEAMRELSIPCSAIGVHTAEGVICPDGSEAPPVCECDLEAQLICPPNAIFASLLPLLDNTH